MSSPKEELSVMLEKIEAYIKTAIELAKLKSLKSASEISGKLVSKGLVLILMIQFLLFLNLGLSLWIGQMLDEIYLGFITVSAFYLFLGLTVYLFLGNKIKKIISEQIISQFLPYDYEAK